MTNPARRILVLNGGSSSIRFALVQAGDEVPVRLLAGKVERAGDGPVALKLETGETMRVEGSGADAALAALLQCLRQRALADVDAVGHRIVHGLSHVEPERLTPSLVAELRRLAPVDPDHLPLELELAEAAQRALPGVVHVACFDTRFHRDLPRVAMTLPIPRRFEARGVRRYGFHGLSYTWLMEELGRRGAARGRVILAHLGGGASLAAVRDGHCIDTTMSFTPTAGLVMGTRSGDLDPSLGPYLERTAGVTGAQFRRMVNHESGLLGVSGSSADMRELLRAEDRDPRAAEAVALFCYQARKAIGAFAAALGGLDTLVFAGGIGEASAPVRERICEGLAFLGVEIDRERNAASADIVSAGRAAVHVIRTDEERVIAREVHELLRRPR